MPSSLIQKLVQEMKDEGTWEAPEETSERKALLGGLLAASMNHLDNQLRETLDSKGRLIRDATRVEDSIPSSTLKGGRLRTVFQKTLSDVIIEGVEQEQKKAAKTYDAVKTNKKVHNQLHSFIKEAGEHLAPVIDRKDQVTFEFTRDVRRAIYVLTIRYSPRPGHKIHVWLDERAVSMWKSQYTTEEFRRKLIKATKAHARSLNNRRS